MLKYLLLSTFALFLLAAPASAADDGSIVATIIAVEGDVTVRHDGQMVTAAPDMQLQLKDTVETAAGAKAAILMIDDTQVTLGEKAKFAISKYAFDEDAKSGNKASYDIINGAFSYIGGLMGKNSKADVNVNTAVGNIGIRGTWFYAGQLEKFGIYLQEGAIGVDNAGGGVELQPGQGTDIGDGDVKPGDPAEWPPEKIKKLKDLVALQDPGAVEKKIAAMQGKQKELRKKHKKFRKKYSLRLRYLPHDTSPPNAPFIPCGGGRGRGGAC